MEAEDVDRRPLPRARAYAWLFGGCLAAALVGSAFDQVTVTVSPDYFVLGKGLDPSGLRAAVAWLGFRAGLPVGGLVFGVGLLARGRLARFRWRTWLATIAVVTAAALVLVAPVFAWADPFDVRGESAGVLTAGCATRYLVCWGLHVGVYAGALVGVAAAWWRHAGRGRRE